MNRHLLSLVGLAGAVTVIVALALLATLGEERPESPPEIPVVLNMTVSRYRYDPGTEPRLDVPLGSSVVIRLTSTDVTHGFAITEYGINTEVPPGEVVEVRFRATKAGDFTIYCTVFCGGGHPEHKGTLHVA